MIREVAERHGFAACTTISRSAETAIRASFAEHWEGFEFTWPKSIWCKAHRCTVLHRKSQVLHHTSLFSYTLPISLVVKWHDEKFHHGILRHMKF